MTTPDAAVRTVAAPGPFWARPGESLRTLAQELHAAGCGALVVHVRDGGFGIVSERDVVRAIAEGGDPDAVWTTDVMTRIVLTTSADEPVINVAEMMLDARVRHVVLVDDAGDVVGIASLRDVVGPLLGEVIAARR